MGIKGSSTATLILEDVVIPAENVLGEVGKGHHVALNILNFARLKLAFGNIELQNKQLDCRFNMEKSENSSKRN